MIIFNENRISSEFQLSALIVDDVLRYNCTLGKSTDFDRIPKDVESLRLSFPHSNDIIFRHGTIPSFPRLRKLEIDVSQLPQPIAGGIFVNLEALDKLTFYHNFHSSSGFRMILKNETFDGLNKLISLNLHSLGIFSLPVNIFSRLLRMKNLDLNQNQLQEIQPRLFNDNCCSQIQTLNLAMNRIAVIDRQSFDGLRMLRQMNLYGNRISIITNFSFHHLHSLIELNLESNRIDHIEQDAFVGLQRLEKLYLEGNLLKDVTLNFFHGLSNLYHLDLGRNKITELSNFFSSLHSLQVLTLSENGMRRIGRKAFEGLGHSLDTLYLDGNLLRNIEDGAFKGLENLKNLYLGRNEIETISIDAFNDLHELKELYVEKNALKNLSEGIFNSTFHLLQVDLSNNPWNCDCDLHWMVEWVKNQLTLPPHHNHVKILNSQEMTCSSPVHLQDTTLQHLTSLVPVANGNASCSLSSSVPAVTATTMKMTTTVQVHVKTTEEEYDIAIVMVAILLVLLLSLVVFALVICCRPKFRFVFEIKQMNA